MRSFFKDRKDFAELYLDFFLNDDSQSFDEAMEKWKFPEEMLLHTIKAGASGYLLKDVSPSELVDAIRAAYRGETKLHPEVAKKLMERVAGGTKEPTPLVLRPEMYSFTSPDRSRDRSFIVSKNTPKARCVAQKGEIYWRRETQRKGQRDDIEKIKGGIMSTQATSTRRYDIDWLRVLAILTVFIFHSTHFFDTDWWHVKNPQTYPGVDAWISFAAHWMMPLIFAISGASTFYALGSRGAGKFLKDRAARLLVPLAVGIFTHAALQVYLERITHGEFHGSFFAFLPHYFDGMYAFGGNFAWMGLHLWYLEVLFVFSLICLPLLFWLKRGSGARLLHGLGGFLARTGAIYLLALPIVLLLTGLDPETPLGARPWGGWSLVPYLIFFLYGFLLVSHNGLQESIRRLRWISLIAGVLLFVAYMVLKTVGGDPAFGTPRYSLIFSLYGLSSWCWVLVIWGFGSKHLNFSTPSLRYANEAVLPFYVMHQTVLLVVGYFVVRWAIPDLLKFGAISLSSLALILVVYEFLVRRSNLLRVLFGMKPLRRAPQPAGPSPLPQTAKS